ncbi:MAG: hemin uptake protein HemP [Steroidobacteraceae bacterium]
MGEGPQDLTTRPAGARRPGASSAPHRLSIDVLLDGRPELIIEHAGAEYRLRITSKGKLILTK